MLLTPKPVESHDISANGMMLLMPMASLDKESHFALYFSWLNVSNALGPLMMLVALYDTGGSVSGIR